MRMRIFLVILVLLAMAGCCCLDKEVKQEVHTKAITMEAFMKAVSEGKTTRELEQQMLQANYEGWLVMDYAVNGDEESKKKFDALNAPE